MKIFKNRIILNFCFFTFFYTFLSVLKVSCADSQNPYFTNPPPNGYAKVRIWNSNFSDGIAGHVSVEIAPSYNNPAGTYVSLWPFTEAGQERYYTGQIASKLNENVNYVFNATAVGHTSYIQDYESEENKHADHVYIVSIEQDLINGIAINMLNNGVYQYSDDNNLFVTNERYRWYAPGTETAFSQNIDENKIYLNCASSSILTLYLGGMPASYIEKILSFKTLSSNFMKLLSELRLDVLEEHRTKLDELSELSKSILPKDVKDILDLKLKDYFKNSFKQLIDLEEIKSLDVVDDIFIEEIMGYLHSELFDESKNIKDIISSKELINNLDYILLPDRLKKSIARKREEKNLREAVIVGVGGTAAIVGVTYMISEIIKKNNCTIM